MAGYSRRASPSNQTRCSPPLAWMLLGVCWLAALVSYLGARRRRRFLDTRTTLESLAAGGWRQFEQLVADAFRRQGYHVEG